MGVQVGLSVWSGLGATTLPYLDAMAEPFDSLWFPDHLQSNTEGVTEGWTLLAHALARFPRHTCGHQVLCNEFRPPALLAKMAASAQDLSGGRVVLGIGAGWHRDEADAFGIPFPSTPERVARLGEAVGLIRRLWGGEPVTHDGPHYRVSGAVCLPAPDPHPPIMIGGSGERHLLAAVAAHADLWNHIYRDLDEFRHKRDVLRRHCERQGRDPADVGLAIATNVLIASSAADLRRRRDLARPVDRNGIAGTPEQVLDALGSAVAEGVGTVVVGFADTPSTEGTELFVDRVLPALTGT